MGKLLDGQPKVSVRIPKLSKQGRHDPEDDIAVPVTINGYTFRIKRGERVTVPQAVADILDESGYLG